MLGGVSVSPDVNVEGISASLRGAD